MKQSWRFMCSDIIMHVETKKICTDFIMYVESKKIISIFNYNEPSVI